MTKDVKRAPLAILAALCAASIPSQATALTGNDLLQMCSAKEGTRRMFCVAYIGGFAAGSKFEREISKAMRYDGKSNDGVAYLPFWCIPNGVTNEQAIDVVVAHLRDNPKKRHRDISVTVADALSDSWPCDGKEQ